LKARYLTDEEYEGYWDELGGVRSAIARHLAEDEPRSILDVGCGWGYYTSHLASGNRGGEVVAIDLVPEAFTNMRRIVGEKFTDSISPVLADASRLPVRGCSFDLATSFLGMRDIYMTTSEEGVRSTVEGMIRALRPRGRIALALTPPDLADSEDQSIAIEVEGDVFGAASPPSSFYEPILESRGVELLERPAFYTGGGR